jgi:predicted PurR-regulated permease PerM
VLCGLKVFGVLGIVLGPVVVAITLALLDVFRRAESYNTQAITPEASHVEQAASPGSETGEGSAALPAQEHI